MKKLLAIIGLLMLTGCDDDNLDSDIRYTYGVPVGVFEKATNQCVDANSNVDRVFITHIEGVTEYEPIYEDGKHTSNERVDTTQYTFIVRCVSGAKFKTQTAFVFDSSKNLDAITTIETTNGSY